jgi:hypothetical protein
MDQGAAKIASKEFEAAIGVLYRLHLLNGRPIAPASRSNAG